MKKIEKLQQRVGPFFKQYARTSCSGYDPNDRGYDRKLEEKLKKLSPEEFDLLMNGEEDKPEADYVNVINDNLKKE